MLTCECRCNCGFESASIMNEFFMFGTASAIARTTAYAIK